MRTALALLLMLCWPACVFAQEANSAPASSGQTNGGKPSSDVLSMDIEQLAKADVRVGGTSSPGMSQEVTTATRTAEPIGRTPAAIYVVTSEMIRRCGARNIPEVLRTVPGVNVARINASTWAITIRGFNGRFANKLLVQVDGVAIYNSLNSGVYWEREPVMLDDIERIEVIRGPGGAIWGNNAVNGIINIITKSSTQTQGAFADLGGGNAHRQFSDARYGGQVGNLTYRAWGSNMNDNCGCVPDPNFTAVDYTNYAQGGFRTDWSPSREDTLTLEGDFVKGLSNNIGYVGPTDTPDSNHFTRGIFATRWKHVVDDDTDWQAMVYYYSPYSNAPVIMETVSRVDFDFQYHLKRSQHDIVWGCSYRNDYESLAIPSVVTFQGNEQIPAYFIQDTIEMVEDRLFITLGSKFDNNTITNFEYQPTVKAAYMPSEKRTWWGSVGRAVRTPSLFDRALTAPGTTLAAENVLTYEMGHRRQLTDAFFDELAVFYSQYNNLVAGIVGATRRNVGHGNTYGFEYNANCQASETWRLTGSYSFFMEYLEYPPGFSGEYANGTTPRNQFYLQSGWDIGHDITFDLMFRYVDSLLIGVENYFVGDVRLAWRPTKHLELSVVGQSLFGGRHYEFAQVGASFDRATQVEPGVYGMASWRY